jgi:hypoxanthine phosphoribosyltransferase
MSLRKVPERFALVYDEKKIEQALARLGTEIGEWASQVQDRTGRDVICVPIMRGGLFFAADLMRRIDGSVEVYPITTSSYSSQTNNVPHLEVKVDVSSLDIKGRSILVIDDICDSGRTLAVLSEKFALAGVDELRSVVLIQRQLDKIIHQPSYVGFKYTGDEWFVGYGMEDSGRWRNLPSVYKIGPE